MTTDFTVINTRELNELRERANASNGAATQRNLGGTGIAALASNRPDFDRAGGVWRDSERSGRGSTAFEELLSTGLKSANPDYADLNDATPDDWGIRGYPNKIAEIIDMAALGRSFLEAVAHATHDDGPLKGWGPDDSPVEIVVDLINLLTDKDVEIDGLKGDVRQAEAAYEERDKSARQDCDHLREAIRIKDVSIAALSNPRVFNVAGMVEADLAERYESMRANYATVVAERDAAEVLIRESVPVVRFVNELATMTDTEADFTSGDEIRQRARAADPSAMVVPRLYGDEDRKRAIEILWRPIGATEDRVGEIVDAVAQALGMRRAGE